MGKIKGGLVKEIKQKQAEQEKQQKLKSKYDINENVVVVEKSGFGRTVLLASGTLVRVFSLVLLCGLSIIGCITLLQSELRNCFLNILQEFIRQTFMGV